MLECFIRMQPHQLYIVNSIPPLTRDGPHDWITWPSILDVPVLSPSLPPVASADPLVSKLRLKPTSFLSCTSTLHKALTVQPVYTCHSLPCSDCVFAPTLLSFCSTAGGTSPLIHSGWQSLPVFPHEYKMQLLRNHFTFFCPYRPFLTAPDLAFVLRGKTLSDLTSVLHQL